MGSKMSPEWWREYRRKNAERLNEQQRTRRAAKPRERGDRKAEYAKRAAARQQHEGDGPLPLLYPELQHGRAVAFWEDELRLDLAQERSAHKALNPKDTRGHPVERYKSREVRERMFFTRLDLLPLDIVQTAQPILGSRRRGVGMGRARAFCHDLPENANGLCMACDQWTHHVRQRLALGLITEEEVRALVAIRAEEGTTAHAPKSPEHRARIAAAMKVVAKQRQPRPRRPNGTFSGREQLAPDN